ncbi:MAG TPA: hypothetical protein VFD91_00765 [Mariniphaga sp.]|nr:hypothetical protein [Mariniphaga sp.]
MKSLKVGSILRIILPSLVVLFAFMFGRTKGFVIEYSPIYGELKYAQNASTGASNADTLILIGIPFYLVFLLAFGIWKFKRLNLNVTRSVILILINVFQAVFLLALISENRVSFLKTIWYDKNLFLLMWLVAFNGCCIYSLYDFVHTVKQRK